MEILKSSVIGEPINSFRQLLLLGLYLAHDWYPTVRLRFSGSPFSLPDARSTVRSLSMQVPAQIAFHGVESSEAVETRIREKVAKLEQFFDRIIGCRVVVERHHRSPSQLTTKDQPFHISIILEVPGEELVVKRDPKDPAILKDHEDINIALRDAFDTMGRRLKDYVSRLRENRHREAS
jgi:putative sigma-54 modulation protein